MIKILFPLLVLLFAVQSTNAQTKFEPTIDGDDRKIRTWSSPAWLAAVGKLKVNDKLNLKTMNCSIFLISANKTDDSLLAKTAAHCVSGFRNGRDFLPTLHTVTFTTNDGRTIERLIADVEWFDYGPGDNAIVVLNRKISNSDIQPLVHAHEQARGAYGLLVDPAYKLAFEPFATCAGYSTDVPFGDMGNHLTYDETNTYLNGGTEAQKDSKCISYGGASGGPMVVTIDRGVDEWEERPLMGTEHLVVGIIKGGRHGNNERTFWVPNSYYHKKLLEVFEKYGIKRNY